MHVRHQLATFALAVMLAPSSTAADLNSGDLAPAFELVDQDSKVHRLGEYQGQWLVLYFYPKDDTPGCTTEACEFRDDIYALRSMGVTVLGVSMDDVKSHKEFAEKYHLPFPLLSDADGHVAREYGSFSSFGPLKFAKRHTFIINPEGRVAKVYRNVYPKGHSDQVIADIKSLAALTALLIDDSDPARRTGHFDFAASNLASRMMEKVMRMRFEGRIWHLPPPDILFLHRELGRLYLLCTQLRALVDVRSLVMAYA